MYPLSSDYRWAELRLEYAITKNLRQFGYVLMPKWHPDQSTIDMARSIGSVIDVHAFLPRSNIPTVQTLRPRRLSESTSNQYSGTYGLDDFPLHTDLAHWARPPRYLMLRCASASADVVTRLLSASAIVSLVGEETLRRAVVRPRRPPPNGKLCLLPLVFFTGNAAGYRWDSLFLVPMNNAAERVAGVMTANAFGSEDVLTLSLTTPGDTLILDNWKLLHGRGSVRLSDMGRRIERVYFSELYA